MNNDTPRGSPKLTLIGWKPDDHDPFPLTPYRDVHTYTPSGDRTQTSRLDQPDQRGLRAVGAVYIPPARRTPVPTVIFLRKGEDLPRGWTMALIALVVMYVTAFVVWGVF